MELRAAGWSLDRIARELEYADRSAASKAIQASLGRVESDSADTLRQLHGERLAMGYRVAVQILEEAYPKPDDFPEDDVSPRGKVTPREELYAMAIAARAELKLAAIDRLTRLMERESKLHGLDTPVKIEANGDVLQTILIDPRTLPLRPNGG
ncbi:hypothetical protein D1871_11030 [Nakamurella silvestris]|nr:hypothetical protein D1871_11030 [Nakamurella silvestris]